MGEAIETLRHPSLTWPADHAELQALIANRNAPRKLALSVPQQPARHIR